jgi:hypothetical protein
MKFAQKPLLLFALAALLVPAVSAQSLKGMSLNGATGLISIPTGRIGWERSANFGIDLGYHAVMVEGETASIPKVAASLFKWVEFSLAFDTATPEDNEDIIISGKLQLPTTGTAVAIGGNAQMLKQNDNASNATQIYIAATYPATFFKMSSETTMVVGKTFVEGNSDSSIDFGMGFDLLLFPDVFQRYVHWVTDFANFSYSLQPTGANSGIRGVLNTGIRIDVAVAPQLKKYKFVIDAMLTDALDTNRALTLGLAAGFPIQ